MSDLSIPSKQKGLSPNVKKSKKFVYVLIALVLLTILGVAGYLLFVDSDSGSFKDLPKVDARSGEDCPDGKWFETHVHLETDTAMENYESIMDKYDIGCSLSFVYMNPEDPADSMEILTEDYNGDLNRLIPFFFTTPETPEDANIDDVKNIVDEVSDYFFGHGELAFYREPFKQSSLLDENWQKIFEYSDEHDFFIMIHLRGTEQVDELEQTLQKYPNAKVLLHGPELNKQLPGLLQKYENLYFTLDTATLLMESGNPPQVLMYSEGGEDAFFNALNIRKAYILSNSYNKWLPVIEAAPDKVFWGTDAALEWHFSEEAYKQLMDVSNKFIEMLPEQYRDGYKYKNAERVFLNKDS